MQMSMSQVTAFSNEASRRILKRRADFILDVAIAMHAKADSRNEFVAELEKLSGR